MLQTSLTATVTFATKFIAFQSQRERKNINTILVNNEKKNKLLLKNIPKIVRKLIG